MNKSLDFGRSKATNWKRNKRIKLPKASSSLLEASSSKLVFLSLLVISSDRVAIFTSWLRAE